MLSKGEIEQSIGDYIVQNFLFGVADQRPDADQSLMGTGIVDSVGIMQLVSFVEKTYGIRIADDDFGPENLDTIERLSRYVVAVSKTAAAAQ